MTVSLSNDPDLPVQEASPTTAPEPISFIGIRSIGIDYGLKRTGVCISVGYAPRALPLIVHDNQPDLVAQDIANLAIREGAAQIVIGFPLNSRGIEGEQANCTRVMVAALVRRAPPCRILLWDERHRSDARSHKPATSLRTSVRAIHILF
jgi:putative Holliday junction resolvase